MSVSAICREVRSRWQAFTQLVWPEAPEQQTQAHVEQLTEELARRYRRLVRRQQHVQDVRARLTRQERQLITRSLRLANPCKDEDRLRRAIERNRERLAHHERVYAQERETFCQRKALRLALLRGQVVVSHDRPDPE